MYTDTIAAPATPLAPSAIGVIRLSGPDALKITSEITGKPPEFFPGRVMTRAALGIDDALVCAFRAPRSYTGEDTVEFYIHGSPAVMSALLSRLTAAGARIAERGEFTRRALMNGKLGLTEAEAVADLIESRSEREAGRSLSNLKGALSNKLRSLSDDLTSLLSEIFAEVDYAEDGVPAAEGAIPRLEKSIADVDDLLSGYKRGAASKNGVSVALTGAPNAGKSSLFNALLGRDRAMVSPIPGTTRDVIDDFITINGAAFKLIDTAGIRETGDAIEREGVLRAEAAARDADVAVYVLDGTLPPEEVSGIAVRTRADLPGFIPQPGTFAVSTLTGEGLPELCAALERHAPPPEHGVINARHADALKSVRESLEDAKREIECGVALDCAAGFIEDALNALGGITGENVSENVLNEIFSRFCVGK